MKSKFILHPEADVLQILLRQGGQMDVNAGDIDGLVGGQRAAVFYGADDLAALNPVHADGHRPSSIRISWPGASSS